MARTLRCSFSQADVFLRTALRSLVGPPQSGSERSFNSALRRILQNAVRGHRAGNAGIRPAFDPLDLIGGQETAQDWHPRQDIAANAPDQLALFGIARQQHGASLTRVGGLRNGPDEGPGRHPGLDKRQGQLLRQRDGGNVFTAIKSELIWPVAWRARVAFENAVARYVDGIPYTEGPSLLRHHSVVVIERKRRNAN